MLNINKPRKFSYNFRYYKPEQEEGQEKRIQFKRIRKSDRPSAMSPLRLLILIIIVFLIGFILQKKMPSIVSPDSSTITIEELEVVD